MVSHAIESRICEPTFSAVTETRKLVIGVRLDLDGDPITDDLVRLVWAAIPGMIVVFRG